MKKKISCLVALLSLSPKNVLAATAAGTIILVETNPLIFDKYSACAAVWCVIAFNDMRRDSGLLKKMALMLFTVVVAVAGAPYLAGFISNKSIGENPSELLLISSSMMIALWRFWYSILVRTMLLLWKMKHD